LDNNGLGCEDGEACTVDDTCQGGYCVGGGASDAPECQCTTNEECEDGDKCNGIMECVAGVCQLQLDSVVTCGDASGQCYKLVCIPETGACEEQPVQAGTACDDGSICTVEDVCDGNGTCEGAANACDDGYFCNGEEVCNPVTGECSAGTPPTLSDGVGCTVDKCDEVNDVITHTANDDYCADGIFCNGPEYCDAVEGCKHEGLSLDDGIACTVDSCDEENDIVLHEPDNSQCNDGQWCNGTEYCSKVNGCMADDVPVLDDGVACTVDTCDEANDEVLHTANHALCTDGNDCNGIEVCDVNVGCKAGVEPDLDDGIDCTIDSCEGGVLKHTPDDSLCNDGKWCNGTETCSALLGCVSVDAPVLSDGVACTQDYCDEALDMVVHKADDTACDNGQYCDGTEYCDAALDCQNGTIPDCGDDDPCTKDICDEALNDGGGACDSSSKVQYCDNTCGGFHAYDAGDNDCGYDDACVGGLAGEGMGDCTPICDADNCAVERSGVIKSPISDYSCVTKFLTIAAPYTYILDVDVKVEVLHANIGDLTVQVVDPAGTVVDLWAVATGGTNDNFYNTFTTSYEDIPGSMCSLQGHKASGMWKLKVCDKAVNNEGYLNSWSLYVATTPDNLGLGDTCEEPIPLASTDGTHDATGTTACANDTYSNSCGGTNGADRVYEFSIAVPKRVTFTVASAFDAIIALKGAEADTCASTTLICKDTCPDDGCTESFSKRLMDVGDYYFFVDSSAFEQGAYTVSATFLTLKDNGEACDASVECLSNYCNNGYCCDEGVCCSGEASSCPPAYDSPSQCTDPAACQGQRQDGTCANFQCSTVAVDDDSGCVGEVANGCGCYLPVICTDEMDQAVASCPTNCTENDDTQCDESCHCSAEDILDLGVCEGDFPDGEACVEDSDCISDNCQNGYCCSGDTCCWTIEDCPPELAEPAVCDSQASCQGHRVEAMCVNSVCDGMSVDDDSACSAGLLADECGYYLSIYCEGGVDQTAPACPESCTVDAECDPDAHCDDVCLPDVENGGECDENSDCVSDYCSNGFCCDGPTGDCCNGDGDSCPADYFETPTCDSPSTCQGSQTGAVCIEFTCVGGTVGNDSECGPDILANACGLYKDIYCTGEKDQPVAACPGSCTLDSECDEPAHCDDICVADLPNGSVCDENSDCISDHCQNGFCCESGDCCSGADETCPEAYYQAPTCDDAANCQGTRLDKLCQDFMCSNEPIADDSGCTTETVSQECGCFAPVYCNGEEAQAAPTCPTTCVGDGDCAETCHCDDTCVPDLDLGEGCDENSDCKSGFCADGVCCSSACDKSCEACDIEGSVGTCTAHAFATDPENDCGLCSQCNGASGCVLVGAGLDPVGDCPAQPENTCQKDGTCDGKGNCRYWVTGTVCGTDSCVGSTKYNADICNGLGTCVDGGTSLCVPYVCNAEETDCLTECDGDEDCVSGYWCNAAGSCVAKQNTGNLCGSELAFGGLGDGSNQCLSDYCIDGYCCNTACSGSCAACNVAGQEGSCAYHAPQTDPEGDCGICMVCNGTGSCTAAVAESDPKDDCAADDPTTCQLDGFCDGTGACRLYLPGTVCGEGFCTVQNGGYDDIENGTKVCDGDGLCIDKGEVICYPYVCNGDLACYDNCITDAECAPDSWCSGAECVLKKDNGETCSGPTAGNECKSDFCVDGVCCENACDGACEACNLTDTEGTCTGHAAQTDPESDCELCFACDGAGGCVSADAGTDPKDECETSSQETCGFDGTCDGAGACRDWIDGTVCKVQECIDWTLHLADTCDGAGTCVDAGTEFCEPYICNGAGSACLTMCEAHGDCFMGYYCDGNQECVQKKELGEPCGEAVECQSDKCVDGFCCASDCTAQCMTCVPAEGHPAGQCHPEADGDDTSGDCPLCEVCDGANACRPADAGTDPKDNCTDEGVATCGFDGTCDGSSACAYYAPDITCAEAYCAEHVAHAEDNCSGDGTCVDGGSTDCSPYQCDDAGLACRTICTEDPHCITTHWCDTFDVADNKCKEKFDNGESCLQATQCKSSFCSPDGVCCDAACDGTCSSCVQAGSVGTCVYFDNDTDPDSECGLCGVCNGSGECKPATGGTDPKGECTATEPVSCGLDGECDGAYACRYWGEQTVCLDQTCVDHTLYPDDVCSGDGSCVDSGEVDCAPYMCNTNDQCRTLCFETAHCVPGYWCDNNNECSYKKPNGYACALDSECISSACVDGYCCDGGCDSTCKTCSGEWNAPYTITVDGSMNGWDLKAHKLGTGASNVKYYFTWDADYMYVAVQGVDLGTDKIFIAFDEDLTPDVGSGASGLFGGVTFEGDRRPEYAIAFSGMEDISYVPHDGGGAWDAAQPVGNQWSHYAGWADNKVSEIAIPRAYLGALDPDVGFAMWVWANNNAETYVWSIWPDTNTIGVPPLSLDDAQFVRDGAGMCVFHTDATDPEYECGLCKACDGEGACGNVAAGIDPKDDCTATEAATCAEDGFCNGSGACRLWVNGTICGDQACNGSTFKSQDICNGSGVCSTGPTSSCCPFLCGDDACLETCTGDDECCASAYCDGAACQEKKAIGETCSGANECLSNFCVDGYCCNEACDGNCEACNLAGTEGTCSLHALNTDPDGDCGTCKVCSGVDNSCANVAAGTDPTNDCTEAAASTCDFDGTCDGAGACRNWVDGTVCLEQFCANATVHYDDTCDGGGTCSDGGSATCEPYVCNAEAVDCLDSCESDDDCFTGYYCDAGNECVPKKDNGEDCGGDNQCKSNFCVDGVCCDTACDGGCSACNIEGKLGQCNYHDNNTDPETECGLCGVCNGAGVCKAAAAGVDPKGDCEPTEQSTCGLDGTCDGNYQCRLWSAATVCLEQSCAGHIKDPAHYCDGEGVCVDPADVDCEPYVCNADGSECLFSCQSPDHCMPDYYCSGQVCLPKKDLGEPCSNPFECLSDMCADGYCCDSPCMGTCASCGLEGSLGTCSAYSAGTDPENECALCTVCGGEMGCVNVVDGEDPMSDCTASLEEDCGFDGACDGNAACRYWADGTICANQYCTDYTLTLPDLCDGTGTCIDQGTALCEPYVCDADGLACRDHCTDNVHCFEGYYCEGNLCVPKKDNGETCSAGFECKSDFCVDGYCCESACDGLCHNCSATPGSCLPIAAGTDTDDECPICEVCDGAGACEPVLAGADPEDDCEVEPEATCGSDGECNGNSACRVWSEGTICLAQYCENGVEHADDTCNGDGLDPLCMDGGTTLCSPYVCHGDGIECLTMCTSNADCVGTHWCDAPNCVLKKAIGSPCNADIECASDYCVDGVCCNNACDGPCESCNVAGQGGSCTFHANQTDPEDDCGTCALCNGGGGCSNTLKGFDPKDDCQYFDQTTCQYDGYCDGLGECAFWDETTVCDGQTCVGSTLYPSDYCDGTGACLDSGIESCCPYTCGAGTEACRNSCSVDGHCCTGFYCHGAACEAKKEDGEVCATDGQCLSGFCVDGYCCNEGCEGDCRSCAVAGSEGVCTNHTSNTDPEYECGLCRVCNGAGGCKNALAGSDAKNQCAQSLAKTCGYDGGCNGAGACAFWDDSTVCKAQMCAGSEKENADMCSGAGACVDGGVTDCCPYVCNDTGEDCRTGCSANYHCCDGYYCFSGECVAQKALGETCNGHTECLSGFCVDGFCCDTNCQLGCESCAIAGQEGTCSFHPQNTDPENNCPQCLVCSGTGNACVPAEAGSDPVNDCAAMAQTSCGYDGNCDGAGACGFWGDGTECFAQYCVGGTVFYADTCNGGGVCTDGGNLSCDGYTCDAAGLDCRTECTEQFHCAFGYYCNDASECVPKKGLGETCDSNDECSSWYCVDGYCCNGPCASQCQACNQAGSEGYCTNLANNTDPESECGPCRVCSGGGSCKNATQGTDPKDNCTEMPEWGCGYDGECGGNGSCEYWVAGTECSAQLCTGSTLYLSDSCNGAGVCVDAGTQSCTPYKCAGDGSACKTSCTTDADCVSGYYCSGAVCVAKKPNGSSCSAANECSSNYCVDGYCCNSGCAGACRACNVAGSQGTCTFYGSGTDPQAECDTCKVCNGSGACGAAEEGTDPKSECSQELPSTCGQDGVCDGDGACRQWPGGTICSDQSCSVDELTATKYCDGDGNCVSSASNCDTLVPAGWDLDQGSPFVCGETDYLVGCSGLVTFAQAKDWCSSMGGRLCTWSELAADEAAGTGCAYDSARVWSTSECQEGHYWTGAGKYSNIGLYPKQCTDGALALANVRCCADVSSCCPYQCSGKGCGTMCGGDDDCCDGYYCEAGQCQSKGNQGQTCMGDDECVTGFCVDGYCCDTACDGLCEACDLAGQEGTCSAIPNNTDPENSCPTCQVCDGNKACKDVPAGADFANDCVAQAASTCESNGLCDGAGACAVWQAGTECQPQVCSDSTLYFADQCNGDAGDPLCSDGGTTSCCPFKCNAGGTGCRESCTSNGQCCAESYCEAGACIGKKANGTGCSGPSECQSGFCVDGVCCDTACDGVCKACNVSGSTGTCTNYANNTDEESECGLCKTCNGAGACKNVTAGQDVKDDCAQQAQESCGFDGTCDGAGHCAYWPDTAQCAAASCGGTSYFPAHFCNGTGTCAEPIEESCCPYKCNGAGSDCKNSCLVDADCCSDYFCQGNACVSKKANGQTCSTNNECSSGKCVDGYCCDNWCAGACQACNVAGKLGACTNHGATTDPEGECGLCKVCDGTGACVNVPDGSDPLDECAQADVTTCGHDGTCNGGGGCRYWADTSVCADQSCAGSTQQSTSYCNGSGNCLPGATANCCPYTCTGNECRTQCDTNSECCSGFFCVANTCVATLPDGSSCSDSAQCSSGFCVDGYCCNTACAGSCEACNVAGKLGVCTLHSINTDPDNECATCNVCNGMGACVKVANGQDPLGDCVEEAPCGQDGYCDGAGVCRFWNDSTECNAQTCSESTLYLADYCDGAGLCEDNGTTSCAPYKCSGNACGTSCVSDSDCVLGYWCDTYAPGPVKECKPKLSNGELCDFANECLSGNCIDGYCCDTTCSGLCRACDIAGFEGQCTHVGNNLDPDAECGLCKACDGAGACKNATAGHDPKNECTQSLPTTCGLDGGCNGSGACRFWSVATECGDQTCTGTDLAPIDYCNGSGTCVDSPTESCCPYKCSNNNACKTSCSVDADCCSGTYYCNGSACVEKLENGDACSASSQCKSGKCVDGFCCDSWCTGTCQGCNVAGAEGACTPRASGSDPENECGNCEQCNGASACAFVPQGQDPLGDCTQEPADSCGTSGACDGAGNCEAWPSGTVCEPQTCVDALVHLPDYCDGSGLCVDSGSASCCPYKCSGDSCRTNCSTNSHCCTGYYCNSGSCITKKANGEACSAASECASGFCADGVCCDKACGGACQACNLAGFLGKCTYHAYLTDPDDDCGVCAVCNGSGACLNAAAGTDPFDDCNQQATTTCGNDGTCNGTGACRKWDSSVICAGQSCSESTLQPTDYCNGTGTCVDSGSVTCCPYDCLGDACRTSCTADVNCCTDALCKNGGACQTCDASAICPVRTSEATAAWCCDGDSCDETIELTDPASWLAPENASSYYKGSTYGSSNQFEYAGSGNAYGSYAPDRVFHFDTKNDTVGMSLKVEVWGTFDTVIWMKKSACGGGGVNVSGSYNEDGCGLANGGSCFDLKLDPGQDYWLYVDGFGTAKGDFNLKMTFTTLCHDCTCDSSYGETVSNSDDCYQAGDFCYNYTDILRVNSDTGDDANTDANDDTSWSRYYDDNLTGDHDDFNHYPETGYTYNYCDVCTDAYNACTPRHTYNDKVYRLVLPSTMNIKLRIDKTGTWSPGDYPRLYVWKGTSCPGASKEVCLSKSSSYLQWGDGGTSPTAWPVSGVRTWTAGTYWIIVDTTFISDMSTAPYRLKVDVWK
jgi:subtilisin-like proprotein convertase family protein